jgi:hypothetical protein
VKILIHKKKTICGSVAFKVTAVMKHVGSFKEVA